MAELNIPGKKAGRKNLHKSARVDLTPMVDLGFLLITFFILTNSMKQQEVMKLILPKDSSGPAFLIAASTTLTFILEKHDSIGYYDGLAKEIKYANFSAMRNIIQQKQISLTGNHIDRTKLTLIIKPTTRCTYKNFIDALDEITINDCRHYYVL